MDWLCMLLLTVSLVSCAAATRRAVRASARRR